MRKPLMAMIALLAYVASADAASANTQRLIAEVAKATSIEGANPSTGGLSVIKRSRGVITRTEGLQLVVQSGKVVSNDDASVVQADHSEILLQRLDGQNFRATVHIDDPAAPERYTFGVDGAERLILMPDGSVSVFMDGAHAATIQKPWARDATGREVPTRFELAGTKLTLLVEHRENGFVYGITADPKVEWHLLMWEVRFSRGETRYIAGAGAAGAAAAASGYAPLWAKPFIAVAGFTLYELAKTAVNRGMCLSVFAVGPTMRGCYK